MRAPCTLTGRSHVGPYRVFTATTAFPLRISRAAPRARGIPGYAGNCAGRGGLGPAGSRQRQQSDNRQHTYESTCSHPRPPRQCRRISHDHHEVFATKGTKFTKFIGVFLRSLRVLRGEIFFVTFVAEDSARYRPSATISASWFPPTAIAMYCLPPCM